VARILVVEDDKEISVPLVQALQGAAHAVSVVGDGKSALEKVKIAKPDLIVLDLGLPDMDGIEVCRNLRSQKYEIPILMLTARTSPLDIVMGLDAGADDYLIKPFRTSELLARLRALSRRAEGYEVTEIIGNEIVLDTVAQTCTVDEVTTLLTTTEFKLLALLMNNSGRVVSREQMYRDIWNTEWTGSPKLIDVHISTLRRKLGQQGDHISTVRGLGFRFDRV
jgi:DNA-binding response OmpR family regulator